MYMEMRVKPARAGEMLNELECKGCGAPFEVG